MALQALTGMLRRSGSLTNTSQDSKRLRTSDIPQNQMTGAEEDDSLASETASSCSFHFDSEEESPMHATLARARANSEPDIHLTEEELQDKVEQWIDDLADLTSEPKEVLNELLLSQVHESGWDVADHLSQVLLAEIDESVGSSTVLRQAISAARLPAERKNSLEKDKRCVICLDEVRNGQGPIQVSCFCCHSLHPSCLSDGLQSQLKGLQATSILRCPACPIAEAAPVSSELAASVLTASGLEGFETFESSLRELQARRRRRWRQTGQASLFCECPSRKCLVRPNPDNSFMQVVCSCSHRFCSSCGQPPHEPIPCNLMMEAQAFLEIAQQQLAELDSRESTDAIRGSALDRMLLLQDLEQAQLGGLGHIAGDAQRQFNMTCSVDILKEDFERLLGARPTGCLRSSTEVALILLQGWQQQAELTGAATVQFGGSSSLEAGLVSKADMEAVASSEKLLQTSTRPCPRCFVPIEKEGGCQHMTCTNARCGHQFCWLCLRDWKNPNHDGLRCALTRLENGRTALTTAAKQHTSEDVLALVEKQIQKNWEAQPPETRPASKEEYATEVRERFSVALTTELNSDKEMLDAVSSIGEVQPMLLSLSLLRFYDRHEREARELAATLFKRPSISDADALSHRLQEILEAIKRRWWLRISPEEISDDSNDAEEDMLNNGGEFAASAQLRLARRRGEHAVNCLDRREAANARLQVYAQLANTFCERSAQRQIDAELLQDVSSRLASILSDIWHTVDFDVDQSHTCGPTAACASTARRALQLAKAAAQAWRIGCILESVGMLEVVSGSEAQRAASSASKWVDEVEDRVRMLKDILLQTHTSAAIQDESAWQLKVAQAAAQLDGARRWVFEFALAYCGGSRRLVQRRGRR